MENEKIVEYLVVSNKSGRKYSAENDTAWGGLIEPDALENKEKTEAGLKIALFASWDFGYLVLETLKQFENKFPDKLNLVGLITDNPLNPNAKISLKKRIWNFLDLPFRVLDETLIIESGLSHGIPVYTGDVKSGSFHKLLEKWNPDVILVCVFGQVIDSFTIHQPPHGIYNFHPSDLSKKQGAGPAPYQDLVNRNATTGLWSVHYISEEIDCGEVVGLSPPVNVLDEEGNLPADPIIVYHKLSEVLSPLVYYLVKELAQNFELNQPTGIDHVDFDTLITDEIKNKIMLPITTDQWNDILSIPEGFLFNPG